VLWGIIKNVSNSAIVECTERPRKLGAKYTNTNIAADDLVQNLKFNWESKRDRWNGFEPEMYK